MSIPAFPDALARYDFQAENLWAVFSVAGGTLEKLGRPAVLQGLYLSDKGEAGRQAIAEIESGADFLGCFDLPALRHALHLLGQQPLVQARRAKGLLFFLLPLQTFLLPIILEGELRFMRVQSQTLELAFEAVREAHPQAILGFGGVAEDLELLVEEMERVLAQKDWSAIVRDRRSQEGPWKPRDLLLCKQKPWLAGGMASDPPSQAIQSQ